MIVNYLVNYANRYASKWLVLAIDVLIISFAFVLSYIIRFNLTLNFESDKLLVQLPVVGFISMLSFLFTGSHKGLVRHTGIRDVYNIFNAICLSSIILIALVLLNREFGFLENFTIPLSIIIIFSLLGFMALTASRYVFKSLFNSIMIRNFKVNKNVLIYGAGESGIVTQHALVNHFKSRVRVVGYIDTDKNKVGKFINGVQVFHSNDLKIDFFKKQIFPK